MNQKYLTHKKESWHKHHQKLKKLARCNINHKISQQLLQEHEKWSYRDANNQDARDLTKALRGKKGGGGGGSQGKEEGGGGATNWTCSSRANTYNIDHGFSGMSSSWNHTRSSVQETNRLTTPTAPNFSRIAFWHKFHHHTESMSSSSEWPCQLLATTDKSTGEMTGSAGLPYPPCRFQILGIQGMSSLEHWIRINFSTFNVYSHSIMFGRRVNCICHEYCLENMKILIDNLLYYLHPFLHQVYQLMMFFIKILGISCYHVYL